MPSVPLLRPLPRLEDRALPELSTPVVHLPFTGRAAILVRTRVPELAVVVVPLPATNLLVAIKGPDLQGLPALAQSTPVNTGYPGLAVSPTLPANVRWPATRFAGHATQ